MHHNPHMKRRIFFGLAVCAMLACAFLATGVILQQPPSAKQMQLSSTAFENGKPIPADYTCDGKNISPPLAWSGAPANAKSFALIVDDPDAPGKVWTHWVVFDLPADTSQLAEDTAKSPHITGNAKQGSNDFGHLGYGGPCPPPGRPHRYFFKLYALDIPVGLKPGASKKEVEAAMANHILAQGQLIGTYQRK
jgi:Raf kinase inhibitor-like YbhB/YbcL family protein